MIFKSVSDSLPGSATSWAFSGPPCRSTQDHPRVYPARRSMPGPLDGRRASVPEEWARRPGPSIAVRVLGRHSTVVDRDRCCPAAWQQYWQQSRRNGLDPRPSAFRPGICPIGADRARVMRCRRSLVLAVGRCYCCHRLLSTRRRPSGSKPTRTVQGIAASSPGRLPPGSCLLTGASAEAPKSSATLRVPSPGTFRRVLVVLRSQSRLRLEGGHVHSGAIPGSAANQIELVELRWRRRAVATV